MKVNPKQMEKMMKQMGMQTQEIDAEEVVIKAKDRNIVISNPQVTRVKMMGQDTFQIAGQVSEQPLEKFSAEDVRMVMQQTGATETDAKAALEETGDLAEAIMRLK